MRILVIGGYGFIGSHIVNALHSAGHEVICAARRPASGGRFAAPGFVPCDLVRDTRVEDWLPRLAGIDAVVNAAGILRETRAQSFDTVHRAAPLALFGACARAGVRKVVQISALGDPRDGGFVASKHALDAGLQRLDLDWTIVRPSVVYSPAGSYGGTSLLRALAALPLLLFAPGNGRQMIQPIAAEDLARAVLRVVEDGRAVRKLIEATAPAPISFENFLVMLRRWLGFAAPAIVHVPLALIRPVAQLAEWLGRGPLGMTMYRMLVRGNTASPGAPQAFSAAAGFKPRTVEEALNAAPSHVQDRWHARLYLLAPLLRLALAFLFIFSGLAGLLGPLASNVTMLGYVGIAPSLAPTVIVLASAVDILLGVVLLTRHDRAAAWGMLLMTVGYTLFLGLKVPGLWFDALGSLIKNVPLIPAILVYLVLAGRR